MYKFGFIGAGNMGGAIAKAVCQKIGGDKIIIADAMPEKATELANKLGCTYGDNSDIAKNAEYIVLGVKPQMMKDVLAGLKGILEERQTPFIIVTMAAGIKTDFYTEVLGREYPIIRIMPNMPVSIGMGTTVYCATEKVSEAEKAEFVQAMEKSGLLAELPEKLIDAASSVSGCGPAFVYMFAESLADGVVKCGLPRDTALELVSHTIIGAGAMIAETGKHPGALKDAVCSPGGTTIEGVHALEDGGFRGIVMDAVEAAYLKNFELGK